MFQDLVDPDARAMWSETVRRAREQRDVQPVGMAMDDVELAHPVCETLQHDGIGEHRIELTGIQTQSLRPAGF